MESGTCHTPITKQSAPSLVSLESNPGRTVIEINGVKIGGNEIVVMAGPCAIESLEQLSETARIVKSGGATILRGGAYKPRTSPYSFQGLKEEGLDLLDKVKSITGLPVVTEVMDTRQVEAVAGYADILQIGSRNMQNFPLLEEAGNCNVPILLKRGMMATLDEYLHAAEYILARGNSSVILCERGIRTFEPSTRYTLDLNAIPVLKQRTHLPVIVDPSHGTGYRDLVPTMSKAAVAAGADGLLLEVHYHPEHALCDGPQSLFPEDFIKMMDDLRKVAEAVGRSIHLPE
ncbi:MAG: 3-deoxy-7-phosphoheptulonate synthase [Bacteroidetes bacterium]|nr:MAG: 3-deoxy-7-phosphoheptulonate synthase [Bacteroidota bacterium]